MNSHHGTPARHWPFSARLARIAMLAGCAALLSGCLTRGGKVDPMVSAPNDYRLRHPITLKETDHTVALFVGNRHGGLKPVQRAEVMAFAQSWRRNATGGIVVEVPSGSANAAAAGGALREVGSIFAAAGIPTEAVAARYYRPKDAGRFPPIRLNYPVVAAEAGPCGLWPNDVGPTTESYRLNKSYWNFGCAAQRNLAAMVANPADLVQPRATTEVSRSRRTFILEQYRKGAQTGSTAPSNDAAKISDVGK